MDYFILSYIAAVLIFAMIMIFYESIKNFFDSILENKRRETERPFLNYKIMSGMVPGGMYSGITFIPGDPNKPWIEGEKYESCEACNNGTLTYYWQDRYYKLKCDTCGYLHDTGMKWSDEAIKSQEKLWIS